MTILENESFKPKNLTFLAVDFDDGAEYGDSDREGQDDEAAEPDSDEVSNDEGLGSDEEKDLGNLTLDNIDDMFNKMHTESRSFSDEDDEKEAQEERQKRKERIKNILQAHTQVLLIKEAKTEV